LADGIGLAEKMLGLPGRPVNATESLNGEVGMNGRPRPTAGELGQTRWWLLLRAFAAVHTDEGLRRPVEDGVALFQRVLRLPEPRLSAVTEAVGGPLLEVLQGLVDASAGGDVIERPMTGTN
jgi:hypothetical protein